MIRILTLSDALRIINDWTQNYEEQPSELAIKHAAHRLMDHAGHDWKGDSDEFRELTDSFDLRAALAMVDGE